jgi:hypothetical protein
MGHPVKQSGHSCSPAETDLNNRNSDIGIYTFPGVGLIGESIVEFFSPLSVAQRKRGIELGESFCQEGPFALICTNAADIFKTDS